MKLIVIYATTDGQTAKIASRIFHTAHGAGHSVALEHAQGHGAVAPDGFDAAIVAGSVHAGHYQAPLADYVKTHKAALAAMPTMLLSVSLTAAGDNKDDWEGLAECVARFSDRTGWLPGRVEHVAGAFKFAEYGFFAYWAMRWIARQKGETVGPHENREYTDWAALDRLIGEWTAEIAPAK